MLGMTGRKYSSIVNDMSQVKCWMFEGRGNNNINMCRISFLNHMEINAEGKFCRTEISSSSSCCRRHHVLCCVVSISYVPQQHLLCDLKSIKNCEIRNSVL